MNYRKTGSYSNPTMNRAIGNAFKSEAKTAKSDDVQTKLNDADLDKHRIEMFVERAINERKNLAEGHEGRTIGGSIANLQAICQEGFETYGRTKYIFAQSLREIITEANKRGWVTFPAIDCQVELENFERGYDRIHGNIR